jgi:hypothetical protein
MKINLGALASSVRDKFIDTFNRANTTTEIGIADDGSRWKALRGVWKVINTQGQSTDTASTYPAITVTMPKKNVTISLTQPSNGTGAMLWVTDSANWWAADVYQDSYSTPWYYSYISSYTCNANYAPVYTCNAYWTNYCTATNYAGPYCGAWNSNNIKNAAYCRSYYYNSYTYQYACGSTCSSSTYTPGSCSSATPNYSYAIGGYNYYYPKYIRILQSVGNTVTSIVTNVIGDSVTVSGLRALISGNQITVRAYGDTNLTNQVGTDLVYTATGAAITAEYGIVVTPSPYAQGNLIDAVTIE